jgi:rhodanese-related sulfurtransferase
MMVSQEVVIVDVRTPEEYDGGHIPNAILVPNESIGDDMPEALPDKEATLLIYCRSGRRSKEASEKLLKLGYKSIYEFGGIIDWPYELVKEG